MFPKSNSAWQGVKAAKGKQEFSNDILWHFIGQFYGTVKQLCSRRMEAGTQLATVTQGLLQYKDTHINQYVNPAINTDISKPASL